MKSLILIIVIATLSLQAKTVSALDDPQYWIWAGIVPENAPAQAELIIYQGNFIGNKGNYGFEHKGLYPYPLRNHSVQLVFRLHHLLDPQYVSSVISKCVYDWNRHEVTIKGIQLDFDSPSAALLDYARFLRQLRPLLSSALTFSITGLGAWLADASMQELNTLHNSVDYITYQFYQGRRSFSYPEKYISFLSRNPNPFKVGLLYSKVKTISVTKLESNPAFQGLSYFIQKQMHE